MKRDDERRRKVYLAVFIVLALYLSLLENFIPKPFPWMRIGLGNIAVLIALIKFDRKLAMEVLFLRVVIQGLMLGTLFTPGFFISLVAGVISITVVSQLYRYKKYLSIVGISIVGAFLHNLSQLFVVYFLIFRGVDIMESSILIFILIFLGLGVVSGGIVGVIVGRLNLREYR